MMLGEMIVPTSGSAGLVSNTIGEDFGSSILAPESEDSKALNRQYPSAIDGDAVVLLGPTDAEQTWVKYGGRWSIGRGDDRFPIKRIISNLTGAFSSPKPSVGTGHIVLLGLLGLFLLRGLR
jgi:hypothetical protein